MQQESAQSILGIGINVINLGDAVAPSLEAINRERGHVVFACANPHSLVVAQSDREFKSALQYADLVVPDGIGIILAARIIGLDIPLRITGNDYYQAIMRAIDSKGGTRVCFFGSSQKVLDLIREKVEIEFPSVEICAMISPPYRDWSEAENNEMIAQINRARPDVLWVGMTAPKQEKWVQRNRDVIDVAVIGSIGAVFDFVAGTNPRAPDWMCRLCLEWLYRLIREPRRMWKRNFVSTPRFLGLAIWKHLLSKAG